jgi:hypothetical protein
MDHHIVNLDNSPWSDEGHYHIGCDNRIDYFKHVGFGVLGTMMNISEKTAIDLIQTHHLKLLESGHSQQALFCFLVVRFQPLADIGARFPNGSMHTNSGQSIQAN